MQAAVIVFPGSNCDRDVAVALEASIGRPPRMVWHRDSGLPKVDLLVVPGGFSYGDYLRCGAMAAHAPIMRAVCKQARRGVPVLGICNGFQILTEAGLLPGALLRNANLHYICRDVHLKVERNDTIFTQKYRKDSVIRIPVAHGDGNYFADLGTLERLEGEGLIAFRYVAPDGVATPSANPNGSCHHIAGIFDSGRRVLGLMPHPERLADPRLGGEGGRPLFDGLVEALS